MCAALKQHAIDDNVAAQLMACAANLAQQSA
jgi:hypothetical protein